MQARLQSNGMMSRQERALPLMHEHSEQIAANRHRKSQNEWCDNGATTAKTIVNIPMLSGNRLFWTDDGNKPVISDSALRLVQSKKRSLNWERIAMELVPSLPNSLQGDASFWKGIHSVPVSTTLHIDGCQQPRYTSSNPLQNIHNSEQELVSALKARFTVLANHWSREAPISVDVSGGTDSTATAYVFSRTEAHMALYHEMPDDPDNHDAEWAVGIATDIRLSLTNLGMVADGNKSFTVCDEYPNGMKPEEPIYWSDIEGYFSRIAELGDGTPHIHVTGFGGDELFASLPASAWSCLREHPTRIWDTAKRYSADYRMSMCQAIHDLIDDTSLGDELSSSFRIAECRSTRRIMPCGWHDAIHIPDFLTSKARELLHSTVIYQLEHEDIQPLNPDRSRHQALYSLAIQARMLNEASRMFAPENITFRSPYLDQVMVDCALNTPISARNQKGLHKAVLYQALKGIAPEAIFRRSTKGDHSYSLYLAWHRSKDKLLTSLIGGILDEEGLIDVPAIRRSASMPMPDITFLFEMQRVAAVERWLRHASR